MKHCTGGLMDKYSNLIKEYSKQAYKKITREAGGNLNYPFIVPGASYSTQLWDWDSWLTDVAIRQIIADNGEDGKDFVEYERGCILNFLEHTDENGKMPILAASDHKVAFLENSKNMHKPCLAQHLAFILKITENDCSWLGENEIQKLESFIECYKREYRHEESGLYRFMDDTAIGVDNDPCIFYRPFGGTASIYLNCLMYKELLAMEYIMQLLGKTEKAAGYHSEAEELKAIIRAHLWDEKCGMYYSADVSLLPVDPDAWLHSGKPRHWSSLIMRIDSWAGFLAMWAGIATPEEAERMVRENMFNENTFWSKAGVRSLSKLEKMYAVWQSGNPSCWLGPIWGNANYFCFRALLDYGYEDEARELAIRTVEMFGKDIEGCGEMHEYYHPDTGEGVFNQSFQSWNLLVNNMIAWLEGRETVVEF